MQRKLGSLLIIVFFCSAIFAQAFHGYVKKADSMATPIFQAKVEILEGGKPFHSLMTYFDGSFKFSPNKNQTYNIQISYLGYKDTSYTITTDKHAKCSVPSVTVKLKKDGMRLMGEIKSREEDFPIKGVVIVLKNVMTQKEDRITTDIDGRYNFKLEYETNYKVWIDKRSPGVFNTYKDTSFYISTIGFNEPLDYKLDILLDPIPYPSTTFREGYDASKPVDNKNIKPEIRVTNSGTKITKEPESALPYSSENSENRNTEPEKTGDQASSTSAKAKKVKEKKQKQGKLSENNSNKPIKKHRREKGEMDVAVIRDNVKISSDTSIHSERNEKAQVDFLVVEKQKNNSIKAEATREQKSKDDSLNLVKEETETKRAQEFVQQKARADSLMTAKQKSDLIKAEEAQHQKLKDDSLNLVKVELAKKAAVAKRAQELAKQKAREDSLALIRAEISKKLAAKQKAKEDSITKVKQEQVRVTLANQRQADSLTTHKKAIPHQSIKNPDPEEAPYLTKTQAQLIAAAEMFAKRKKFLQDSIARVKELEKKNAGTPPASNK